jgi:hypothetical protein
VSPCIILDSICLCTVSVKKGKHLLLCHDSVVQHVKQTDVSRSYYSGYDKTLSSWEVLMMHCLLSACLVKLVLIINKNYLIY